MTNNELLQGRSINESHDLRDGDYVLHVTGNEGDVEVWLNRLVIFNGIAIGGGESRAGAVRDAIATLEQPLRVLKERG